MKHHEITTAHLRHPDFDDAVEFLLGYPDPMLDEDVRVTKIMVDDGDLIVYTQDPQGNEFYAIYHGYQFDALGRTKEV